MKNTREYKTTGEWFRDAKNEGYSVPLPMCLGLDVGQRELKLSFGEVFELFTKEEIIVKIGYGYIYNMRGYEGIKNISS